MLLVCHIGNAKIYLFHINRSKPQMWKKSISWIFFKDEEKQNDEQVCACLKEPYCRLLNLCCGLNRWDCRKTHVGSQSWSWRKSRFPFPVFSFLCVLYIQVITPFATQPLALSRGRAEQAIVCVRSRTHTWTISVYLCVSLPSCVHVHTVCIVGAGALLSQPITFTSTPNLSWVSRVRVKAEEVTTRKWLLPHHKWGKRRGNGSGERWRWRWWCYCYTVAKAKTVRMEQLINK